MKSRVPFVINIFMCLNENLIIEIWSFHSQTSWLLIKKKKKNSKTRKEIPL